MANQTYKKNAPRSHHPSKGKKPPNTKQRTTPPKRKRRRRRRGTGRIFLLLLLLVCVGSITFFLTQKNGSEVFAGSQSIGVVKINSLTAEELLTLVAAQLESETNTKVKIKETLSLKPVRVSKNKLVTKEYIASQTRKKITYEIQGAVITADGEDVAILQNKEEAQKVLDEIMGQAIPEGSTINTEESGFVQKVEVVERFVAPDTITSYDEAKNKLTTGTVTTQPYTIQGGDSLYKIAGKANMTVEELLAVNPEMNINSKLVVGTNVNVTVMVPFLSVKTVENATYIEKIERETETREDASKPAGYRRVIQQGKDGEREVTAQLIRVNGVEQEKKEVSSKTLQEAEKEIVVVGPQG